MIAEGFVESCGCAVERSLQALQNAAQGCGRGDLTLGG